MGQNCSDLARFLTPRPQQKKIYSAKVSYIFPKKKILYFRTDDDKAQNIYQIKKF